MKKSWKIWIYILEVIAIIAVVVYLAITKALPKYQETLGSSEKIFSTDNYETGVEFDITTGPAFFLVINKDNEVANIFIENEQAGVIANQDIEGKSIEDAIPEIFQKLIDANLIENQIINAINYNDHEIYEKVISLAKNSLLSNAKTAQIVESKSTLQEKATRLNMEETEDSQILWTLYLNSADLIENLPKTSSSTTVNITRENASIYADTIYEKIITYMVNANVENQERDNTSMPIQYIPGNNENTVYASSDSWYYIRDYKAYAQITITGEESYTFCYVGSKTDKKEGMCS